MPNRVIKESIKRSPQIDALTWFEEVVFYRLMVTADDYGCMDARPVLLKNELFPTKENITKKSIEDAVGKLVSVGLLHKYEVNGMPYLFFPTWEKHQRIRNKHRKYPEPPSDIYLTANCCQVTADCSSESNPIQSESESKSESNTNPTREAFDVFWEAYPRKVGKGDARKAFSKVKADLKTLLSAVDRQKNSVQWQRDGGRYIPNPATWLNQGRWEDELPVESNKPGGSHSILQTPKKPGENVDRMRRYLQQQKEGGI